VGLWTQLPSVAKAAAALIAAVAALLAALVAAGILPLDPPPVLNPEPPTLSLSAVLFDLTIADQAMTLGDFCERRNLACQEYDEVARRRPGNVVRFTVETDGYVGQKLPIRWSMYDASTQRIVNEPTLRYQDGWPAGFYVPAAANDRTDGELWVPLPPTPGTYFVRVEIQSPEREILNTQDTQPFEVR
jgi:hypothetical protein